MSKPDPMLDCEYIVWTDDPVHAGKRVALYYCKDKIPEKFKGKEVKLKKKGVKEPKEK